MRVHRLLAGLSFLILVSSAAGWWLAKASKGGELVAIDPLVVWRSPSSQDVAAGRVTEAVFHLRNGGGTPVRVADAESGCGCAKPVVEPAIVPPGSACRVRVAANPFEAGEKLVPITLHTDSASTPVVALQLRMIGSRRPPFLLSAGADLSYPGELSRSDTREMIAVLVSGEETPPPPEIDCDLPFLRFEPSGVDRKNYAESQVYAHGFRYLVRFSDDPPTEAFAGTVKVVDPWDSERQEIIHVACQPSPALRVVPSRVRLARTSGDAEPAARLAVVTRSGTDDVRIVPDSPGADVLLVEGDPAGRTERYHPFVARSHRGSSPKPGEYTFRARVGSDGEGVRFTIVVEEGR